MTTTHTKVEYRVEIFSNRLKMWLATPSTKNVTQAKRQHVKCLDKLGHLKSRIIKTTTKEDVEVLE